MYNMKISPYSSIILIFIVSIENDIIINIYQPNNSNQSFFRVHNSN